MRAIKNALRVAHAMAEDRINCRIVEHLGAKLASVAEESPEPSIARD